MNNEDRIQALEARVHDLEEVARTLGTVAQEIVTQHGHLLAVLQTLLGPIDVKQ